MPTLDIITDTNVTGKQFIKDPASGTYVPYEAPKAEPVLESEPTVGEVFKEFTAPAGEDDYDRALRKLTRSSERTAMSRIDEDAIRDRILAQFQAEIDATNQIYATKLDEARQQGLGRLGSSRATQARSGLLGSDFGASQTAKVERGNQQILDSVVAEQAVAIQAILGNARKEAAAEIAAKREAQQKGLEDYLTYLGTRSERTKTRRDTLAASFIAQGIDPTSISPTQLAEIARSYGIGTNDILADYQSAKSAYDAEQAVLEREQTLEDNKAALESRKVDIDEMYKRGQLSLDERRLALDQLKASQGSSSTSAVDVAGQLQFLLNTTAEAKKLAGAVGPSAVTRKTGDLLKGNSKFRQLEQQIATLQSNMLTIATDPNIKKFFGPQMSDADVRQMLAAASTMNAQNNTEAQLVSELNRLETIFSNLLTASGGAVTPNASIDDEYASYISTI